MGKRESKITDNGQGELDISKTKDVREAIGGRHSDQDKGDQDDQGQRDDQE